jgi:gliding motility-associated-like protein
MQIEVYETNNKPPVISPLTNICIEAGDSIEFIVSATDPNNDRISLKATSGIFGITQCQATFRGIDSVPGSSSSRFKWKPCHEAVRSQPYNIIFKADDNNSDIKLSDIDNMTIKVLGPAPSLQNAVPEGKFIRLSWLNYGTNAIAGFAIYRRIGASTFIPDSCTAGIPASTGFVRVGYVAGSSAISFTDTNNGLGLEFGEEYTYRITAVYQNGAESKASNEIYSTLVAGLPVIRNVSVRNTDISNGSIYVAWKKPDHLDTIPGATGPYEYKISRAQGVSGTNFTLVKSLVTTDLNDTVFIDTLINTRDFGYLYKIVLWNRTPGNFFVLGDTSYASSTFITLSPGDRKVRFVISRNVPWINTDYDFFRLNKVTSNYEQVGTTSQLNYIDDGLVNGENYCYYVRSTGNYLAPDMPKNLINFSQVACATPVDNEPPCIPVIDVKSQCDSMYNHVTWGFEDAACLNDVAGYKIFYKLIYNETLDSIYTIDDKFTFSYKHYPGDIIAGCYAVSAFDSIGNESDRSVMVCVDSCNFYEIPNVFTPNNDNFNDRLVARTSGLVEKINFKLFNRTGLLIFSTDRPKIDWDGTYKGKVVSPGVYFYQCDVYERRINTTEHTRLSGFVHVITEAGTKVIQEETK